MTIPVDPLELLRNTRTTETGEGVVTSRLVDRAGPCALTINRLDTRLDLFGERLARLESSITHSNAHSQTYDSRTTESGTKENLRFVTHAELASELEHRFEIQNRAVQSLRTMVARTDELLEQVIESIESMSVNA
jgi:uncharacterized coiled-coil protein SlyX